MCRNLLHYHIYSAKLEVCLYPSQVRIMMYPDNGAHRLSILNCRSQRGAALLLATEDQHTLNMAVIKLYLPPCLHTTHTTGPSPPPWRHRTTCHLPCARHCLSLIVGVGYRGMCVYDCGQGGCCRVQLHGCLDQSSVLMDVEV